MKSRALLLNASSALLFATLSVGCPREEPGPLQQAGEAIDEAASDAKSAVEDAFDDDGLLERGGEAIDEAAEDVKSGFESAQEDLSE